MGTYQIAVVWRAFNKPVYVAAESYKVCLSFPLYPLDCCLASKSGRRSALVGTCHLASGSGTPFAQAGQYLRDPFWTQRFRQLPFSKRPHTVSAPESDGTRGVPFPGSVLLYFSRMIICTGNFRVTYSWVLIESPSVEDSRALHPKSPLTIRLIPRVSYAPVVRYTSFMSQENYQSATFISTRLLVLTRTHLGRAVCPAIPTGSTRFAVRSKARHLRRAAAAQHESGQPVPRLHAPFLSNAPFHGPRRPDAFGRQ